MRFPLGGVPFFYGDDFVRRSMCSARIGFIAGNVLSVGYTEGPHQSHGLTNLALQPGRRYRCIYLYIVP